MSRVAPWLQTPRPRMRGTGIAQVPRGGRPEGWVTGVRSGQGCPPSALHAAWGVLGGRFPGWGWGWGARRPPSSACLHVVPPPVSNGSLE